jgi:hypothetical protein
VEYVVDEMDGIGGMAVMISCGDEAPARGMSRLEFPPHINIDAAEALAWRMSRLWYFVLQCGIEWARKPRQAMDVRRWDAPAEIR